jgi:hypothetical protein
VTAALRASATAGDNPMTSAATATEWKMRLRKVLPSANDDFRCIDETPETLQRRSKFTQEEKVTQDQ